MKQNLTKNKYKLKLKNVIKNNLYIAGFLPFKNIK